MITLVICGLASIGIMPVTAQNNPYKINDECYRYFLRANRNLSKPDGIVLCDSFRLVARRHKDVKAQCIYYFLKTRAYRYRNDLTNARRTAKEGLFCLNTPYHQYYWSTQMNLNAFITDKEGMEAGRKHLTELSEQAEHLDDDLGRSVVYGRIGTIYYNYQDYTRALSYMMRALQSMHAAKDYNNLYTIEYKIASILFSRNEYIRSDSLFDQSLKHAPLSLHHPILLQYTLSLLEREKRDSHKIDSVFALIAPAFKAYNGDLKFSDYNIYTVNTSYYLYKNQLDSTKKYLELMEEKVKERPETRNARFYRALYLKALGQPYAAFDTLKSYLNFKQTQWEHDNAKQLLLLDAETGKLRVEGENKQLLIDQLKSQQEILQIESTRNLLRIRNGNLELQQRDALLLTRSQEAQLHRAEADKQRQEVLHQRERNTLIQARADARHHRTRAVILLLMVVVLSACLIISILSVSRRNINRRRLEAEQHQKEAEIAREEAELARLEAVKARKQAERADELKTLFLQNMSHEIRTPLNAIVGFNEILNGDATDDLTPEEKHEFTSLITTNASLLTTLVNDILDLSKLESGTYHLALSEVSAKELCYNALNSVKGRESSEVTLQAAPPTDADADLLLYTDAVRVQQVLINYLTNACKNTEQGSITLAYHAETHADNELWVHFSVTDTGCGVPPDKIEDIFKRFEKLDNFKQGTGLGLNICTRIADLLHGQVYVDTTYHAGARFAFDIPVKYTQTTSVVIPLQ